MFAAMVSWDCETWDLAGVLVASAFILCAILAVVLETIQGTEINIFDQISLLEAANNPALEQGLIEAQAMAAMMIIALLVGAFGGILAKLNEEGAPLYKRPAPWITLAGVISIIWPAFSIGKSQTNGLDISLLGASVWCGVAAAVVGIFGGVALYFRDRMNAPSSEAKGQMMP